MQYLLQPIRSTVVAQNDRNSRTLEIFGNALHEDVNIGVILALHLNSHILKSSALLELFLCLFGFHSVTIENVNNSFLPD